MKLGVSVFAEFRKCKRCLAVSVFAEFWKCKKCVWLFQCLQCSGNARGVFGCFSVCRVQEM